jgi:magnesium chelatase family protein
VQTKYRQACTKQGSDVLSLSVIQSRALLGLAAPQVCVEVHLANGLPSFTLVGLADTEVKEARERVRSALQNSGLEFPANQRITVNLAPADLPKDSGRFDLPIALGLLAAHGVIDAAQLAGHEFAGELSLGGELRPVRGALAMALALQTETGVTQQVTPTAARRKPRWYPAPAWCAHATCWTWWRVFGQQALAPPPMHRPTLTAGPCWCRRRVANPPPCPTWPT